MSQANKDLISDYFDTVWNGHQLDRLERFVADELAQHNPNLPDGRVPLEEFLRGFFAQMPDARFVPHRIIAEGDLVVAHSLFTPAPGATGMAVVDIFRVVDGRIVEHWDVKEEVPSQTANGRAMV